MEKHKSRSLAVLIICVLAFAYMVVQSYMPIEAYAASAESASKTEKKAEVKTEKKKTDTATSTKSKDSAEAEASNKTSKSKNETAENSDDVVEENANQAAQETQNTLPNGNATLGEATRSTGDMEFYTIRTKDNETFYLVIDHSGTMDNVYLMSLVDEKDLEGFGSSGFGGSVVTDDNRQKTDASAQTDPDAAQENVISAEKPTDKKDEKPSRESALIALAILAGIGVAGIIAFLRHRRRKEDAVIWTSAHPEVSDGLATENEDEERLE